MSRRKCQYLWMNDVQSLERGGGVREGGGGKPNIEGAYIRAGSLRLDSVASKFNDLDIV